MNAHRKQPSINAPAIAAITKNIYSHHVLILDSAGAWGAYEGSSSLRIRVNSFMALLIVSACNSFFDLEPYGIIASVHSFVCWEFTYFIIKEVHLWAKF